MLLNIAITPAKLIDMAKDRSGMELQEMAEELGYHKTRITQLKKERCALTPSEIKYYADKAGLPFEQTICELEVHKNPAMAKVWGIELTAANSLLRSRPLGERLCQQRTQNRTLRLIPRTPWVHDTINNGTTTPHSTRNSRLTLARLI